MSCMRIAARICACKRVSVCVCVDKIRILYRYCILRWTVQIQLPNGIYSLSIFLLFSIIKTTKWMGVYSLVRLFACFCSFFLQQLHTNHMKTIDAKERVSIWFLWHMDGQKSNKLCSFRVPTAVHRCETKRVKRAFVDRKSAHIQVAIVANSKTILLLRNRL